MGTPGYSPKISCVAFPQHTWDNCAKHAKAGVMCDFGAWQGASTSQCGYWETTGNPTILGDLRVSKFLVELAYDKAGLLPQKQCVAFRPGHLKYPTLMDEALEATGYHYVSVVEANEVLSHQYFQKTYQASINNPYPNKGAELDVFEFPILFDDISGRPLKGGWEEPNAQQPDGSMLYHTVNVAEKISKFGGIAMLLVYPTDESTAYTATDKIEWIEEFVARTQNYSTVVTFTEMGDFARGRNAVQIDITHDRYDNANRHVVHLNMDPSKPVKGLTLEVPVSWIMTPQDGITIIDEMGILIANEWRLVRIENLTEDVDITFTEGTNYPTNAPTPALPTDAPTEGLSTNAPTTAVTTSTPTPTDAPTRSAETNQNECASCDLVPCGYCQQGCPGSPCSYESSVDKAGKTSRNWCDNSNFGEYPPACRAAPPIAAPTEAPTIAGSNPTDVPTAGPPTGAPTPATSAPTNQRGCASCDLVPCGYCQQDCPGSPCSYESSVDKAGKTSRNWCDNR